MGQGGQGGALEPSDWVWNPNVPLTSYVTPGKVCHLLAQLPHLYKRDWQYYKASAL